jgi:oxygen-independent coproporphyrinogen-3 oxidase
VLLDVRLAEGLAIAEMTAAERARVPHLAARNLVADAGDRLTLTLPGRLLADAVVRNLLD